MRESWRKNELKQQTEWVSSGWVSHSHKGDETEAESTETSEVRDEMWGEVKTYVLAFVWNWAEVGFRYKSNGAFYTLFFFFFLKFRPESSVSADIADSGRFKPESAQIRANRLESELRRHESAKSTWNTRGTTRPDARVAASPARRRVLPQWTRVRHLWCRVRAS